MSFDSFLRINPFTRIFHDTAWKGIKQAGKYISENVGSQATEDDPELLKTNLDSLSPFQNLLDSLGVTNYAGKLRASYANSMDDREYNNYTSVAERMKDAGLNPDLQGVPGYESAAGASMNENLPQDSSPAEVMQTFSNAAFGLFGNIEGVLSGVLGIKQQILDQDKLALDTMAVAGDDLTGTAVDTLAGRFLSREGDLTSISLDELRSMSDEFIDEVVKDGNTDFVGDLVSSPRLRKSLNKRIAQRLSGARSKEQFYNAIKDSYDSFGAAKMSQATIKAVENATDEEGKRIDFYDSIASVLMRTDLISKYNELRLALNDQKYLENIDPASAASAENAQNVYSGEYYRTLDGSQAAEVTNKSNEVMKKKLEYDDAVNETKNELMGIATKLMNSDDKLEKGFGVALGIAIPAFLGDIQLHTPQLPSISSQYSVRNNLGRNGNLESRTTRNFHIGR